MVYVLIFLLTAVVCYHYYIVDQYEREADKLRQHLNVTEQARLLAVAYSRHLERVAAGAEAVNLTEQTPRLLRRHDDT